MLLKILSKTLVLFTILVASLLLILLFTSLEHSLMSKDDIRYYVSKYKNDEAITMEEVCSIYRCNDIYVNNKTYLYDKDELKYTLYGHINFIHIYDEIYLDVSHQKFSVKIDDMYVYIDFIKDARDLENLFIFFLPLILILFFFTFYRLLKDELLYSMLHRSSVVNNMEIMTTIKTAENTAHEVRTPLDIITSKMYKIRKVVRDVIQYDTELLIDRRAVSKERLMCSSRLRNLIDDMDLIDISLTQISDQIDMMSGYKNMLHSNGNKTLHDIVSFAKRVMTMKHDNIAINLSIEFMKYGVVGIKNSEFLGILVNHLKNSVEANAFTINIELVKVKNNLMTISITDDGNGIPKEIIKELFLPNKSSKQLSGEEQVIRGNGMFSNKLVITKAGGNIWIDTQYTHGTKFFISFPVKLK